MYNFSKINNPSLFLLILSISLTSCVSNNTSKLSDNDNTFSSNSQKPPPALTNIYDSIAIDICDCLQPMIDIIEASEISNRKNDEQAMIEQQNKITQVRPRVESCTKDIKSRYEKIESPETNKRIMAGLKQHCPISYEIINKTMAIKL